MLAARAHGELAAIRSAGRQALTHGPGFDTVVGQPEGAEGDGTDDQRRDHENKCRTR